MTDLAKKFQQKLDFLQLKCKNDEKNINFIGKPGSKMFSEDIKCSLDKDAEINRQKGKGRKSMFFSARFSSKRSAGHVEINFDEAAELFALKVRKKFAQSKKMIEEIYTSQNRFSAQNVNMETHKAGLTSLPKIFIECLKVLLCSKSGNQKNV